MEDSLKIFLFVGLPASSEVETSVVDRVFGHEKTIGETPRSCGAREMVHLGNGNFTENKNANRIKNIL